MPHTAKPETVEDLPVSLSDIITARVAFGRLEVQYAVSVEALVDARLANLRESLLIGFRERGWREG